MNEQKYYLGEGINVYNKTFKDDVINVLNAPPSSGKSYFIYMQLIQNLNSYYPKLDVNKNIYYIVDTSTLEDSINQEIEKQIQEIKSSKDYTKESKTKMIINLCKIVVCTYVTFRNKYMDLVENNLIIFDEYQNLYNYTRYDWDSKEKCYKGAYVDLVENLNELARHNYIIGLSGTDSDIFNHTLLTYIRINNNFVFTKEERRTLKRHNFKPIFTNNILNFLYFTDWSKVDCKGVINTNQVRQCRKYKHFFDTYTNKNSLWLCSTRKQIYEELELTEEQQQDIELGYADIKDYIPEGYKLDGKENGKLKVKKPCMTPKQLEYRTKILAEHHLPEEIDILIVNGAYETGWNLEDLKDENGNLIYNEIQMVIIDNTNVNYMQQARARVRHNIETLVCLCKHYAMNPDLKDDKYYGMKKLKEVGYEEGFEYILIEDELIEVTDFTSDIVVPDKLLNRKLTEIDKKEIKLLFEGRTPLDDTNAPTIKGSLLALMRNGYLVKHDDEASIFCIFNKGTTNVTELYNIIRYLESKKSTSLNDTSKTHLYGLLGLEKPKGERVWDKKLKKKVTVKKFDLRLVNKKLKDLGLDIKLGTKVDSKNNRLWIVK